MNNKIRYVPSGAKMVNIDFLKRAFIPINPQQSVDITDISETDFTLDIIVSNSSIYMGSTKTVEQFFGNVPLKVVPIPNSQAVKISISKVNIPSAYGAFDYLRFIEKSQGKNLFLGIGNYGSIYINPDTITHAGFFGKTGYGKSSFFKYLLSQMLAFRNDTQHLLISPKPMELEPFKNHPNVVRVASSKDDYTTALVQVVIEMAVREHYFNNSFTTAPSSLAEYNEFKKKYRRRDLPTFKPLYVWVDEAHAVFNDLDHTSRLISHLFLMSRAYGIKFLVSTQRPQDIPSTIRDQLNNVFTFFLENPPAVAQNSFDLFRFQDQVAIPGRLQIADRINQTAYTVQTPMITTEQAQLIAFSRIKEEQKKTALFPIKFAPEVFSDDFYLGEFLAQNHKLTDINQAELRNFNRPYRGFNFTQKSLYVEESLKQELVSLDKTEVEVLEIEETNKNRVLLGNIKTTNNTIDFHKDLTAYLEAKKKSKNRLEDFLRPIETNPGILQVFQYFHGEFVGGSSSVTLEQLALNEIAERKIKQFIEDTEEAKKKNGKAPILILSGKDGLGKRTVVDTILNHLSIPQRNGTPNDLNLDKESSLEALMEHFDHARVKGTEKYKPFEAVVFQDIDQALFYAQNCPSNEVVVAVATPPEPTMGFASFMEQIEYRQKLDLSDINSYIIHIEFKPDFYRDSKVANKLIDTLLKKADYNDQAISGSDFLKARIEMTPEKVSAVINQAKNRALQLKNPFVKKYIDDLLKENASRVAETNESVTSINPEKSLVDLIAPARIKNEIEEIIFRAKNLAPSKFSFAKKLRRHGRCVALFAGLPGTGKSMSAEVIAKEIGKKLWVGDFSRMQSKFVGETEQLITQMFEDAKNTGEVLLLDEVDAFLGNRSEINHEYNRKIVNHLLNEIDNFNGVLFMTTNFGEGLDPALERRIDFKIKFENPTKPEMVAILKSLLIPDAPLVEGIDFEKVFEGITTMNGGLIRNSVERVVFRLEKEGREQITFEDLRETVLATHKSKETMTEVRKQIGIRPD